MFEYTITFLLSFLIGSIPFGYIFVKRYKHLDIRTVGSGNIGSTNVARIAGKKIAILTQLCDLLKGIIPVSLTILFSKISSYDNGVYLPLVSAFGTIFGHDFSPFLKFKGGKGVNTTLGAFLPLIPVPIILTGVSFKLLYLITPIVSIRSMISCLLIIFYSLLFEVPTTIVYATIFASGLILFLHKDNIKRLIKNVEN